MTIWYSTGTATFTNGSTTVTGSGTSWNAQGVARPGYAMHGPDGNVYEITAVASDTSMTIAPAYLGATVSGADYRIQPTGGPVVDLLTRVDQLLSDFEAAVNGPLAGRHPDGTLSAPALSFAADQDTGFWRKASGTVGYAANGSETVEMGPGGLTVTGTLSGTAVQQSATDATAGRLMRAEYGYSFANVPIAQGVATLTRAGTVGTWIMDSRPFTTISLPADFPDSDYHVSVSATGADNEDAIGDLVIYDKTINAFKIAASGSTDNITITWTAIERV